MWASGVTKRAEEDRRSARIWDMMPSVTTESVERETLHSGDLECVPISTDLVGAMHEAISASGQDLSRWMLWWKPDFAEDETRQFVEFCEGAWASGTHYEFAVRTPDFAYAGSCGLTSVDRGAGTANLAYWTRSDSAGRHVASRAARLVAAWGVSRLGLRRIEVSMATANIASRRVAERSGAIFEGVLRSRV